jgi:hypothetical protein
MKVLGIETLSELPKGGGSSYVLMGCGVNLFCTHSAKIWSVMPMNAGKLGAVDGTYCLL